MLAIHASFGDVSDGFEDRVLWVRPAWARPTCSARSPRRGRPASRSRAPAHPGYRDVLALAPSQIAASVLRDAADRAVTDAAWASLVRSLGTAQLLGWDSCQLLIQSITQRELGTAADVAAVLHRRGENITGHSREAPEGPSTAAAAAQTAALTWRERAAGILETARGDTLTGPVSADAADALLQVADAMDSRGDRLALHLAELAATGQQGGYENGHHPDMAAGVGAGPHLRPRGWRLVACGHDPAAAGSNGAALTIHID